MPSPGQRTNQSSSQSSFRSSQPTNQSQLSSFTCRHCFQQFNRRRELIGHVFRDHPPPASRQQPQPLARSQPQPLARSQPQPPALGQPQPPARSQPQPASQLQPVDLASYSQPQVVDPVNQAIQTFCTALFTLVYHHLEQQQRRLEPSSVAPLIPAPYIRHKSSEVNDWSEASEVSEESGDRSGDDSREEEVEDDHDEGSVVEDDYDDVVNDGYDDVVDDDYDEEDWDSGSEW